MAYEFKQQRMIPFSDTDMAGIVHFARFFPYMEDTEHAFLRSLSLSVHTQQAERNVGWPRLQVECSYKQPLRFEDQVEIHLVVRERNPKTIAYDFTFRKRNHKQAPIVARGSMTVVCAVVDEATHTMKSIRIPKEFTQKIEAAPKEYVEERN